MSSSMQIGNHETVQSSRSRSAARRSDKDIGAKPSILVVEDELFVAWHLEALLQDLDFDVCGLAADGPTAIAKADAAAADLVLMDINLKGQMDGVETARRIRQSGDAAVIFITAYDDAGTLARIREAVPGALVLTKPISPGKLKVAIAQVLGTTEPLRW